MTMVLIFGRVHGIVAESISTVVEEEKWAGQFLTRRGTMEIGKSFVFLRVDHMPLGSIFERGWTEEEGTHFSMGLDSTVKIYF